MIRNWLTILGLLTAMGVGLLAACDAEDGGDPEEDPATDLALFSECNSVEECLVGEEEGGACETTPVTPDTMICTADCHTIAYDVPDPEVGECYTPTPADTCAGGCCLIDSVEVVNDFGDEEGGDMLDPTALLVVLDALVKLTDGLAVDPQAGTTI